VSLKYCFRILYIETPPPTVPRPGPRPTSRACPAHHSSNFLAPSSITFRMRPRTRASRCRRDCSWRGSRSRSAGRRDRTPCRRYRSRLPKYPATGTHCRTRTARSRPRGRSMSCQTIAIQIVGVPRDRRSRVTEQRVSTAGTEPRISTMGFRPTKHSQPNPQYPGPSCHRLHSYRRAL
jgi:hypothetical protein